MRIKDLIEEGQAIMNTLPKGGHYYDIPNKQRYYTWTNNIETFLEDIKFARSRINQFKYYALNFRFDEMLGMLQSIQDNSQSEETIKISDKSHLTLTNRALNNINIESLILTIRVQKVMVDFDLAMLYGVLNKRLNEQVKRNIKRFPDDFMFQLTKEEWNILRSQIATAKTPEDEAIAILRSQFATTKNLSKIRTLPYAFTRNGIGMLSSVLGSETAVAMNIRIMRAFTASQQIMESNAFLFNRVFHLEQRQQETDEKISALMTKMDDISPKLLPEQIFATGCVWDAWTYVSDLVRSAKKRIVLIDNFVDDRVLTLLDKRANHVEATIHSRYYEPFQIDLKKHNEQYREIKFIQLPQKNHDRFLIIDDDVYLLGASVKDMGVGMCAVTKMMVSPETILGYLK